MAFVIAIPAAIQDSFHPRVVVDGSWSISSWSYSSILPTDNNGILIAGHLFFDPFVSNTTQDLLVALMCEQELQLTPRISITNLFSISISIFNSNIWNSNSLLPGKYGNINYARKG